MTDFAIWLVVGAYVAVAVLVAVASSRRMVVRVTVAVFWLPIIVWAVVFGMVQQLKAKRQQPGGGNGPAF